MEEEWVVRHLPSSYHRGVRVQPLRWNCAHCQVEYTSRAYILTDWVVTAVLTHGSKLDHMAAISRIIQLGLIWPV